MGAYISRLHLLLTPWADTSQCIYRASINKLIPHSCNDLSQNSNFVFFLVSKVFLLLLGASFYILNSYRYRKLILNEEVTEECVGVCVRACVSARVIYLTLPVRHL